MPGFSEASIENQLNIAETPEIVDGEKKALSRIRDNFGTILEERFGENGKIEKLPFHNIEHSSGVAEAAKELLEKIKEADPSLVTESDIILVQIEAMGHDLVQGATLEDGKPRQRHRGAKEEDIPGDLKERGVIGNERESAMEVLREMGRYKYPDGAPVFPVDNQEFRQEIMDDIAATYPDFAFAQLPDGENALKVFQPYLLSKSSLRAFALATADLRGEAGSKPESGSFPRGGDAEFREMYPGIAKELAGGSENISKERRADIAEMILNWKKTQPGFAKWQKVLFLESIDSNKIINSSPKKEEIKKMLLELLPPENFDRNIGEALAKYTDLESRFGSFDAEKRRERLMSMGLEDFKYIVRSIGYKEEFTVLKNAA